MRVMVIGSGGREHALVWKLKESPRVSEVVCVPGNGGIESDARCIPISGLDNKVLVNLARKERIDFVIVGPEAPLADGIVDAFTGIPVLGPDRAAARLESSKVFAKEFMAGHRIPTADFSVCNNAQEALATLDSRERKYPLVVKADGLAAGKGVVVAATSDEARKAIDRIMVKREFGAAGDRVVIEDCLEGSEASFIVFTDGKTILPAVPAQDHKTVYDGDRGPNTGGMGAYSSKDLMAPEMQTHILDNIVRPVLNGMESEGAPFKGILYTGLMLTAEGPKVLEFNVRMGDPEAQAILPRLESDFASLCELQCMGKLETYRATWKEGAAVCVVLASGGYPGNYDKGKLISGLEMAAEDKRIAIFHSGTRRDGEKLLTNGGRVLGVTAVSDDLQSALMSAYEGVNKIRFEGMHYRRDIGARGLMSIPVSGGCP